jgi:hypothetical protein
MMVNDIEVTGSGKNISNYLSKVYNRFMSMEANKVNGDKLERFEIYDIAGAELLENGYQLEFMEMLYRITDNECPNEVIIDILNRVERTPLLSTIYGIVEDYRDLDLFKLYKI